MTRTRWWVVATIVVVLALLAGVLAYTAHAVRSPSLGSLPDHADAIVVFAGERDRIELAQQLVAEGRADTLVLSNGEANRDVSDLCGQTTPYTVICERPDPVDTRGESRMFARIAADHGWHDLIAVTSDYHVARARLLLDRCWPGTVAFAAVPWRHIGTSALGHEVGGLIEARTIDRSC